MTRILRIAGLAVVETIGAIGIAAAVFAVGFAL